MQNTDVYIVSYPLYHLCLIYLISTSHVSVISKHPWQLVHTVSQHNVWLDNLQSQDLVHIYGKPWQKDIMFNHFNSDNTVKFMYKSNLLISKTDWSYPIKFKKVVFPKTYCTQNLLWQISAAVLMWPQEDVDKCNRKSIILHYLLKLCFLGVIKLN